MKNPFTNSEERSIALIGLAALFHAARIVAQDGERRNPKASFDDADKFLREAERRMETQS